MFKQPIIFNGFMGVGKTTIAKNVANKLDYSFIDIDAEIVSFFKLPITEIFKQFGETTFREKETELIKFYALQPLTVISLGGGAFKSTKNADACLNNGIVIHLDLSYPEWKKRIPKLISTRPILQNKTNDEIKQLFDERQQIYQKRHLYVLTDHLTENEVTEKVLEKLTSIKKES